ncbi:MAG: hypothetical protein RJA36_216 [Pseudomonadota bacterium]|jgi:ABC-2 type transport system permease protein/ribosome-dependent ATPase
MNLRRISTLVHKELREVLRDRLYLMLAFLLPVTLMFVFAYGMTSDVKDVGLVVVDEDQSLASRDYARRFLSTRHFRLLENQHPATAADQALIGNRARVVLWIGPEFGARLAQGRPVDVSVQIDGAFTASARTIRGYVEAINAQANAAYRSRHAAATFGGRAPVLAWIAQPVQLRPRFLYNPELRSVAMVAPSLLMLVLMLVPPLLIAVSVVREKETGAIFNIASSTVTRMEFLLGKLLPVVAIAMLNGFLLWLMVIFWFDVPFRGNPLAFTLAMLLYVLATAGLGLLVSAAVKTQQAAIIITTLSAVIASMQMAGFFAPLETAVPVNQYLAWLFPAKDFLGIVRGMYTRGAGIGAFWPELLRLAAYACAVLWFAHALFHKRGKQ